MEKFERHWFTCFHDALKRFASYSVIMSIHSAIYPRIFEIRSIPNIVLRMSACNR